MLLTTRKDIDATIFRTPGMLYQQLENEKVSNLYSIKIINKTHKLIPVTLKLETGVGTIQMVGKDVSIQKESKAESAFFIIRPRSEINQRKTTMQVGIYSEGKKIETVKTTFWGPVKLK